MAKIFNTATLTPSTELSPDHNDWIYNGLDCCVTEEILQQIKPMLDNTSSSTYAFSQALQGPVLEMSMRGLRVNQLRKNSTLRSMRGKIEQVEGQLDRIIREGVGTEINWRSPKQLGNLLYNVMNLPVQKKRNANGEYAPTTDREALEKLSVYYIAEPIVSHLLLLRDLAKSVGFLETGIDPDGRMRSNFNIAGTNTGRFASAISDFGTGTNLQNVNRELRAIFMADPGWKFANLDLEQADSRNLGGLCWELQREAFGERYAGAYLDACESGDLHTMVSRLANPAIYVGQGERSDRDIADQIAYRDKSFRDLSKVLGHGSNYVGQPPTMAKHSKLPVAIVRDFQVNYFAAFPCIPQYHEYVKYQLQHFAQLTTLFGRRRFFFGRPKDASTIREAVAYSPQSMTADEINTGLLNLWRANRVQLLVQVHDSILFQYREEEEDEIIPWALEALKVPLELAGGRKFVVPTEAQIGWNWGKYNADDNPDGLQKWKGGDTRKRTELGSLSIRGL